MKTFAVKVRKGDLIQLFNNAFMVMMGVPIATGRVTSVRLPGDGFEFQCIETGSSEVIAEGDGILKKLPVNGYHRSR